MTEAAQAKAPADVRPEIAQTVIIGVSQTRLLATAMAAQQAAADRVRAILDTLVVGRDEVNGLVLLAVDTDEGHLHFGRPGDAVRDEVSAGGVRGS